MSYIGRKSNSRSTWQIKPVTKIKKSKKAYNRKEHKQDSKKRIEEYA